MKKNITKVVLGTLGLLLIPLVAMQFTAEVDWDLADFIIMGVMLFATGLGITLATRHASNRRRNFIVIAIILVFLYIWAELAVGIFNIPGISGS